MELTTQHAYFWGKQCLLKVVICAGTSIPSTLDFSKKTEHVPIKALVKSFSLPSPLPSLYHFIIMSMMLAAWELSSRLPEFPRHWSSLYRGAGHITVLNLLFVVTCLSLSLYSSFWMTLQQREADFLTALSQLQLWEQNHQLEQTKKPPYKL